MGVYYHGSTRHELQSRIAENSGRMIEFEPMMDMEMFAGLVEMEKPPPKPIEKPQRIPPIRKPEVEKKHIEKDRQKKGGTMQLADANGPIYQKITEMATPTAGQAGVILAKPTEYIYSGILPTEDCPIYWWLVGLLCILIVCIVIYRELFAKIE